MKNKFKLIVILLLIIIGVLILFNYKHTQNLLKNKSQELSLIINDIQKKVRLIDIENNYQIKTLKNEQFLGQMTDGGGELIGYFKDGEIKKIKEILGLSYGVKTYEYYFSNEQLILVYEKDENFPYDDKIQSLDQTKLKLAFEGHYYFKNEKLINKQTTGIKRFSEGDNINMEEFFLKVVKENINLLKK